MSINRIQDHCDISLVRCINKLLHILSFTKSFVYTKVADRQKTPVYRISNLGNGHHLNAINAQVLQIIQLSNCFS